MAWLTFVAKYFNNSKSLISFCSHFPIPTSIFTNPYHDVQYKAITLHIPKLEDSAGN